MKDHSSVPNTKYHLLLIVSMNQEPRYGLARSSAQVLSQGAIKMSSRPVVIGSPEKDLFKLTQCWVHPPGYRIEGLSSSLTVVLEAVLVLVLWPY